MALPSVNKHTLEFSEESKINEPLININHVQILPNFSVPVNNNLFKSTILLLGRIFLDSPEILNEVIMQTLKISNVMQNSKMIKIINLIKIFLAEINRNELEARMKQESNNSKNNSKNNPENNPENNILKFMKKSKLIDDSKTNCNNEESANCEKIEITNCGKKICFYVIYSMLKFVTAMENLLLINRNETEITTKLDFNTLIILDKHGYDRQKLLEEMIRKRQEIRNSPNGENKKKLNLKTACKLSYEQIKAILENNNNNNNNNKEKLIIPTTPSLSQKNNLSLQIVNKIPAPTQLNKQGNTQEYIKGTIEGTIQGKIEGIIQGTIEGTIQRNGQGMVQGTVQRHISKPDSKIIKIFKKLLGIKDEDILNNIFVDNSEKTQITLNSLYKIYRKIINTQNNKTNKSYESFLWDPLVDFFSKNIVFLKTYDKKENNHQNKTDKMLKKKYNDKFILIQIDTPIQNVKIEGYRLIGMIMKDKEKKSNQGNQNEEENNKGNFYGGDPNTGTPNGKNPNAGTPNAGTSNGKNPNAGTPNEENSKSGLPNPSPTNVEHSNRKQSNGSNNNNKIRHVAYLKFTDDDDDYFYQYKDTIKRVQIQFNSNNQNAINNENAKRIAEEKSKNIITINLDNAYMFLFRKTEIKESIEEPIEEPVEKKSTNKPVSTSMFVFKRFLDTAKKR